MKKTLNLLIFSVSLCLSVLLFSATGFSLDAHQVYFASDSGATICRDTSSGPDLYLQSLFSRLKAAPPLGLTILPDRDLPSEGPCRNSKPNTNGVGGLKILDWNTACKDAAGNGMCNWSCDACPTTGNCTIYKNHINPFEQEADWCCCASRRACLDQSDAKYIILQLVANDLWQVYNFYNRDVDRVVDQAKSLTTYLTGQGRTVIWLSYCPLAYGSLGGGEKSCSNWTSCLYAINSNVEYFYSKFSPWMNTQQNVHLIDFFSYVKATYGANANFINQYGFDGVHLKPGGHQIYYNYVYAELSIILDRDGDGVSNDFDNCPNSFNPDQADADKDGMGDVCDSCPNDLQNDIDSDGVCGDVDNCPNRCNIQQLDADEDSIGDVCDPDPWCGECGYPQCEQEC
jgi:lysophospholipase L1-like esterase